MKVNILFEKKKLHSDKDKEKKYDIFFKRLISFYRLEQDIIGKNKKMPMFHLKRFCQVTVFPWYSLIKNNHRKYFKLLKLSLNGTVIFRSFTNI